VSVAVALADKIDTLTGFWAIDEKPTGSKDPFALRRAGLGVVRVLQSNSIRIQLQQIIFMHALKLIAYNAGSKSAKTFSSVEKQLEQAGYLKGRTAAEVLFRPTADVTENQTGLDPWEADIARVLGIIPFLHDRLKVHLRDQGIPHDVIDASLAMPGNDDLTLLVRRAEALAAFLSTSDGTNLVQLFKRAANILAQAEERDGVEYSFGADPKWAEAPEERALFAALDAAEGPIREAMVREDFAAAMQALAGLRQPIDAFFEAVQVNSENSVIRRNRLNLLSRIRALCLQVADLSRIEG
jgi:glycyl-tRNA synthetase beta chain